VNPHGRRSSNSSIGARNSEDDYAPVPPKVKRRQSRGYSTRTAVVAEDTPHLSDMRGAFKTTRRMLLSHGATKQETEAYIEMERIREEKRRFLSVMLGATTYEKSDVLSEQALILPTRAKKRLARILAALAIRLGLKLGGMAGETQEQLLKLDPIVHYEWMLMHAQQQQQQAEADAGYVSRPSFAGQQNGMMVHAPSFAQMYFANPPRSPVVGGPHVPNGMSPFVAINGMPPAPPAGFYSGPMQTAEQQSKVLPNPPGFPNAVQQGANGPTGVSPDLGEVSRASSEYHPTVAKEHHPFSDVHKEKRSRKIAKRITVERVETSSSSEE